MSALISLVHEVGELGERGEAGEVGARGAALDDHVEEVAPGDADDRDQPVEQDRDEHRGEHAGHDQALDRADAEHLHRVDLLADLAGAEVGADRRAAGAGDEQGGDDRAGLADHGEHDAAPVNDWAPSCRVSVPSWRAMTAPNGIETRAVGTMVTEAMNQHCWMNSLTWNGRFGSARKTSRASAKSDRSGAGHRWRVLTTAHARRRRSAARDDAGDAGVARLEGPGRRGDAVVAAPARRPGRSAATRRAVARARAGAAIGGSGGSSWPRLGGELVGVLLLGHADRADRLGVEELPHDGLLELQQHLARPEHGEVLVVEQADVVGHGAGRVDVVGDDEEGRVDLGVEVDEELVDVGRAHRVETGVRLVDEQDLGVEDERPGQAGALAHAAGDLPGQLGLGAGEADEVHLLHHDARISASDFLVCSRSGKATLS